MEQFTKVGLKKMIKKLMQAQLIILFFANAAVASEERAHEGRYLFVGDEIAIDICSAALKSKTFMVAEAKRLHLTRKTLNDVTCNGQSLTAFASANKLISGSRALASAQ